MNPLFRNDRAGEFPNSWYAASADIPDKRAVLKGQHQADVCIIGAGFTGLTAALRLAEKGFDVTVLDAHRAGFGASGRNGGQVGTGYKWDQASLAKKMGDGPARAVWDLAEMAKADIAELAAKHAPEARLTPGVAHGAYSQKEIREIHEDCDYQAKTYGYTLNEPLDQAAFNDLVKTDKYRGGALDMGAGHIHPLRYALGLARAAEAAGVTIYEGSPVHNVTKGDPAKVQTDKGHVMAKHVIYAGNGYLPNIEDKIAARVMPINSFICATEPLGDRAAEVLSRDIAVADDKFVVNYYRMSEDKRFLFGGRENYGIGFPKDISTKLIERMESLFPQLKGVGIDYVWGGTLGITMTRLPCVQRIAPNIWSGAGFSGHGVALSGFTGRVIAEAIAGQEEKFDAMSKLPVPPFPGGSAFRMPLLTLAMTWYALRDRLGV